VADRDGNRLTIVDPVDRKTRQVADPEGALSGPGYLAISSAGNPIVLRGSARRPALTAVTSIEYRMNEDMRPPAHASQAVTRGAPSHVRLATWVGLGGSVLYRMSPVAARTGANLRSAPLNAPLGGRGARGALPAAGAVPRQLEPSRCGQVRVKPKLNTLGRAPLARSATLPLETRSETRERQGSTLGALLKTRLSRR
jgi:hypothetical protein